MSLDPLLDFPDPWNKLIFSKLFYSYFILFSFSFFSANTMTLAWLSNNMSADYEDVHIPVKKAKPKQAKVVTFWCAELGWLNILLTHWLTNLFSRI